MARRTQPQGPRYCPCLCQLRGMAMMMKPCWMRTPTGSPIARAQRCVECRRPLHWMPRCGYLEARPGPLRLSKMAIQLAFRLYRCVAVSRVRPGAGSHLFLGSYHPQPSQRLPRCRLGVSKGCLPEYPSESVVLIQLA